VTHTDHTGLFVQGAGTNIATNVQALHTCRKWDGLPQNTQHPEHFDVDLVRHLTSHASASSLPRFLSIVNLEMVERICWKGFAPKFAWEIHGFWLSFS
jgi:hypothetical protein